MKRMRVIISRALVSDAGVKPYQQAFAFCF